MAYTLLFAYLLTLNVLGGVGYQAAQKFDPLYWLDEVVKGLQYGDLKLVIGQAIGAVFVVFCIFIMIIAETGNEKLGFNFALLTYYASRPRETQFNAFMANNFIDNVIAASVINLNCGLFGDYPKGSFIYWIFL